MEQNAILKKALLQAIKNSDFTVEINEPNNVDLCTKYDGTEFLLMRGDTAKFGVWSGDCTVTILGHSFTCDLDYGEWSAGDSEDSWLLEEEDFVDALESADGVIFGEQTDVDAQRMVYCRANNISEDIEAYWVEEDDIPKDINHMDWCGPETGIVSVILNTGNTKEVECDLECDSIYKLYCILEQKGLLYKTPSISSSFIKNEVPDLHQEIVEQLHYNDVVDENTDEVQYSIENTKDFFDSILG